MSTNYLQFPLGMNEDSDDASGQIVWPATVPGAGGANTSYLIISGGEQILLNKGYNTSYTSEDGLSTITFGSYLTGTTVTGTGHGTSALAGGKTCYYDGPWAAVPANTIDHTDPNFNDIKIWGDVDWAGTLNPDGITITFPVYPRSGPQVVTREYIADYAITNNHLHSSMAESGHVSGGTAVVWGNDSQGHPFFFGTPNANDWLEFKTKDGRGDSVAVSNWPNKDGSFLLSASNVAQMPQGGTGYFIGPLITATAAADGSHTLLTWPYATGTVPAFVPGTSAHPGAPNSAMIALCTLFPGGPSAPTYVAGHLAAGNYTVRFAFTKSITVAGIYKGVVGTYTQTIETPLSTPLSFTVAANQAAVFTLPAKPAGFTGTLIYALNTDYKSSNSYSLQGNANYSTAIVGGLTQITFGGPGPMASSTGKPSFGFSAWPPGTALGTDLTAQAAFLMPWAHLSEQFDTKTGNYSVQQYNGTVDNQNSGSVGQNALQPKNIYATNQYAGGNVLGQDASGNFSWVNPGGTVGGNGGGITVDFMTAHTGASQTIPITNPVLYLVDVQFLGNGAATHTVTFPTPFPHNDLGILGYVARNAASVVKFPFVRTYATTNFVISPSSGVWTNLASFAFQFTVIGY